ncbi:MAG: hypothetical protein M5U26_03905 [Planctomycetota bacterium]|nr:hypothetical protein [Planctomycetota bacterium]
MSVVLARAEGGGQAEPMAVLSSQRYGCGRSLVLEGQGMWRWGFRPPEDRLHGQDLFHAFWANLVRWLAGSNDFLPSQDCVLRPGKPVYQTGESLLLYVMKRESAPEAQAAGAALPIVEILREDETGSLDREFKPFRVPARPVPRDPQVFQAEFEPLDEGHYRAQLVDSPARADTTFEVLPPLRERLDLRARPDRLAGLSQATDARALALDELDKLHEYFGAYVQRHKPGQELKRPAWDETWVFLLLAAWAGATWWLRRRWGAI